jgi:hypothetical protein
MNMKWMASALVLAASACLAQQMDERNDPALQLTIYTPRRISMSKERQGNNILRSVWTVVPFIAENYDHTNKFLGIVIEVHGNKQILNTGAGGLMFTVDGKQSGVSPAILAHSHRRPTCGFGRCNVIWNIQPRTPVEESSLAQFVKTVANGHQVYATLFPGDTGGGQRFTALLTDEQLLGFHDVLQYYNSLALVKKVVQKTSGQ